MRVGACLTHLLRRMHEIKKYPVQVESYLLFWGQVVCYTTIEVQHIPRSRLGEAACYELPITS